MTAEPAPLHSALLPYIVAATFFMEYLDTTIIATALPQMARSFRVGPNEISLGMTAYMLTLAVFIPISGWIADRVGSRTTMASALGIFTMASVLCGFSTSVAAFTAARVLQGIGGAMMVPVGRMIVVRNTEKSRLVQAISTITWPAIIAPVIGPSLGGFITTYASWHWVFLINVPIGILALIAIVKFVPNQQQNAQRPLDGMGFVLSGVALTCLLYGTELASHQESRIMNAGAFILAGLVFGFFALRHLRAAWNPLVDLKSLEVPTYAVTVVTGSLTRVGIEAVPYLAPLLFQIGFGLSAFQSGLMLLATATGNLGMKAFTTPVIKRFGFRSVAIVNCFLAAVFVLGYGWLRPSTPLFLTLCVLFAYGVARSMQYTTLATLAYADVEDAQKGPASTLWSVAQQATLGMGIAFAAVCLRVSQWSQQTSVTHSGEFVTADFRWAFTAASLVILISLIGYVRLPVGAGSAIAARRPALRGR